MPFSGCIRLQAFVTAAIFDHHLGCMLKRLLLVNTSSMQTPYKRWMRFDHARPVAIL
jgi:hypothetical protein